MRLNIYRWMEGRVELIMKKNKTETLDMNRYEDLLNLPPHKSATRPSMSLTDRAAQFSPFAALTGYEHAIKETARITDQRIWLDETAKSRLDEKLSKLQAQLQMKSEVEICYFVEDKHKEGGKYETVHSVIKKIDAYEREVILCSGQRIDIEDIIEITGDFEEEII